MVEDFKEAASLAAARAEEEGGAEMSVEFGAVNCVVDMKICNEWFGIRA